MKYRVEMKRRHVAVIFLDRRITSHSKSSWWFSWKSASTRIRSHITLYLFEIKIVIQNDTDNFSQCSNKRLIAHIYRIYRNQVQYWSWFRSLLNHDTKFDLTPTWSFVSTSLFHKGFFSFLDRMLLFLSSYFLFFFSFYYQGISFAIDFPMSKDFSLSKELPRVNFVKCAMWTKY